MASGVVEAGAAPGDTVTPAAKMVTDSVINDSWSAMPGIHARCTNINAASSQLSISKEDIHIHVTQ